MTQGQITDPKAALSFILAGKAVVTFRSLKSGNSYTYKIAVAEKRYPTDPDTWFVKLLNGQDNESSYVYIGFIRNNQFIWTSKSRVGKDAPSVNCITYVVGALAANDMNNFEVWHEGRCGRCGRKLTVPESVASGFGPECAGLVGMAADAAPVVAHGIQHDINFDGSVRETRPTVKVNGVAAPATQDVGELDTRIRARIATYKSEAPENYYQDGELDEKQAFNVAYNRFRVEIERGNRP